MQNFTPAAGEEGDSDLIVRRVESAYVTTISG